MPPLVIPPELKKITQYIRRAEELDKDDGNPESTLVAYYLRQYAVSVGIPLSQTHPGAKACLGSILGNLEVQKEKMNAFSAEEAAFVCRAFAKKIFDKADGEGTCVWHNINISL
jgi:vacuolar protein sorting-associated protein VTA1